MIQTLGYPPDWHTDVDYCSGLDPMARPVTGTVLEVAAQQEHAAFWRRPPEIDVSWVPFTHFRRAKPALDFPVNHTRPYFVSGRNPELGPTAAVCDRQSEPLQEFGEARCAKSPIARSPVRTGPMDIALVHPWVGP